MTGRRRPPRAAVLTAVLALVATVLGACTSTHHRSSAPLESPTSLPSAAPFSSRPNVVLVLTDDLSTDLVAHMPHVRELTRRGATFTNYSVTDSLCCPSRASIFTGRYPHDTGVYGNVPPDGGITAFDRHGGPKASYGPALQAAGYHTAMMGKYLNGYLVGTARDGLPANYVPTGWDAWAVGAGAYRNFDYSLNVNGQVRTYGSRPQDYLTRVITGLGSGFVADSVARRKPFALELATYSPHSPYTPDPLDAKSFPTLTAPRGPAYDRTPTDAPRWLRVLPPLRPDEEQRIDAIFRQRVRAVQSVDRAIGQLEDVLRRTGQLANTVIAFTSDNGFHLGQYRLRPGKRTAFDTDVHVPLVMAGPGIPAGRTIDANVQNVDLAPTFEDLAGAPVPSSVDGRSLVPLLRGSATSWRTLGLIQHHGPGGYKQDPDFQAPTSGNPPDYDALRGNGWTFVRYADGEREYYDRVTDPDMLHNTWSSLSPQRRSELERDLDAMVRCHGGAQCWQAGRPDRVD